MPKNIKGREQQSSAVRIPPHNYEAEECVLGSVLIDKDAMTKIADFLLPEDFYGDSNRRIYEGIFDLYSKGEPIDVVSLANWMRERKRLSSIGGEATIAHLATVVPTAGNVVHYARIVQKCSTLRRLITAAANISEMGFEEERDIEELLDEVERELFSVSREHRNVKFTRISEALEEAFERIDKLHKGDKGLRGVVTGYPDLDLSLIHI